MRKVILAVVLMTGVANGVIFDDGGVHDIDWAINEPVIVEEDAFFGGTTTVNFLTGSYAASWIEVYDSSLVNINGGAVHNIYGYNSSEITVNNGVVYFVDFYDNSQVTINGGEVMGVSVYDTAQAVISGGTISGVDAHNDSRVTISGGTFEQTFYIGMGSADVDEVTMEFIGTDFAINGTPVDPGEFTNSGAGSIHGTLTGTLANSDPLGMDFWIYDDSRLVLSAPAALEGDANRDGQVSAGDYASVQANFGNTGEPNDPTLFGDANLDGQVSAGDYASVQANFGNVAAMPIPEPAFFSLLSLGGLALLRRKRK